MYNAPRPTLVLSTEPGTRPSAEDGTLPSAEDQSTLTKSVKEQNKHLWALAVTAFSGLLFPASGRMVPIINRNFIVLQMLPLFFFFFNAQL